MGHWVNDPDRDSDQSGAVGGTILGCCLGGLGLREFERSQWMGTSCNFSSSPLSPISDPTSVRIVLKIQNFIFFSKTQGIYPDFSFFFNFWNFSKIPTVGGCGLGLRGFPRVQVLVLRGNSPKWCPQLPLIYLSQFPGSLII